MIRNVSVSLLAIAALLITGGAASRADTLLFPNVAGRNLNGKAVDLPKDFQAPASIVYVAFTQKQQHDVDTWKPFVASTRRASPALGEYEVPVLAKSYTMLSFFIEGGMRRGISDTAARAATITLYVDKGPFDRSLGIASEDQIAVFLVKPDGTVLWHASGSFDAGKTQGLDAAIASIKSATS
jgi:hypothetical protein